jgi:putative protease
LDVQGAQKAGRALLAQILSPRRQAKRKPELAIRVDDTTAVQVAVDNGADIVYFGGESFSGQDYTEQEYDIAYRACREKGRKIVFSLPRIIKPGQISEITQLLEMMQRIKPDAIAVANIGALQLARKLGIPMYADYQLNIFNNISLEFFREHDISHATLSPELSMAQVEQITQAATIPVECLVHGQVELMVTEYCAVGSLTGGLCSTTPCRRGCRRGHFGLKDRMGMIFPIETDQYCRMHIFNTKELSMLSHLPKFTEVGVSAIRIEAKRKSAKEVAYLASIYRQVLDVGPSHPLLSNAAALSEIEHKNITRGHYFRGVL